MKNKLMCPACGKRLIDSDNGIKTKLFEVKSENILKHKADYYLKCPKCGKEIALKKVDLKLNRA